MGFTLPLSSRQIAERLGARLLGDPERMVVELCALNEAKPNSLAFMQSAQYSGKLSKLTNSTVLTLEDCANPSLKQITFIIVENPKRAFIEIARLVHPKEQIVPEISKLAVLSPDVELAEGVSIEPYAVLGQGAKVGARSRIGAFSYVGRGVEIGNDTEISPHVVLLEGTRVGNGVKIFSGTVIGSDGFGLLEEESSLLEIPHFGGVVIGDGVRVGANCTIDRAMLGKTTIEAGTKIDDQVHIAHNVRVGKKSILCGQVGISGSSVLEEGVMLGGQVGVRDHIRIGKGARVGAQSGVGTDLPGEEDYFMSPAVPLKEALRLWKAMRRLPQLARDVSQLLKSRHPSSDEPARRELSQ